MSLQLKDSNLFRTRCHIDGHWLDADSGETIDVHNPATGEKIEVAIRKEFCSDGMSDQRYEYSVQLRIGEMKLMGCASN